MGAHTAQSFALDKDYHWRTKFVRPNKVLVASKQSLEATVVFTLHKSGINGYLNGYGRLKRLLRFCNINFGAEVSAHFAWR